MELRVSHQLIPHSGVPRQECAQKVLRSCFLSLSQSSPPTSLSFYLSLTLSNSLSPLPLFNSSPSLLFTFSLSYSLSLSCLLSHSLNFSLSCLLPHPLTLSLYFVLSLSVSFYLSLSIYPFISLFECVYQCFLLSLLLALS